MFLDDTACNLASLNLLKFESTNSDPFDFEASSHAVRLWTLVLDISVTMAQFPSKEIARRSYDYRTLGLGYANLGGLLMSSGIACDSRQGRALCATLLHGGFARRVLTSRRLRSCYSSEYRTPRVRLRDLMAIATSVARRVSWRDFKVSPMTRL